MSRRLLLLFFLSASLAFSDSDTVEEDSVIFTPTFDSRTAFAVTNLARALAASSASPTSVEDTVNAIYTLLSTGYLFTVSQWSRQVSTPISAGIANGLFESGYSARTIPATTDSFLYKILQELRALPDYVTNSSPVDLSSIISSLESIDSNTNVDDTLASLLNALLMAESYLETINYSVTSELPLLSANTFGSNMWHSHLDDSQLSTITASLESALQQILDAVGPGYDMMTQATQETRLEVKEALARLAEKVNLLLLDIRELIEPVQSLDSEVQDQTLLLTDSRNDLHSLLLAFSNSTNIEVVDGFNKNAGVTNAPTVGQMNGQFQRTENLASTNETAATSELKDYESASKYELPVLDFSQMIPGEITPLRAFEPNFDNAPNLADNYSIPILSTPLQAGSVTINAFSLDLATGSTYDNVMRPFKQKIGPITEQIWNLVFAISVLLLAKYEWKAYMAGVGPSVAAHEQQERQDYDGYIF